MANKSLGWLIFTGVVISTAAVVWKFYPEIEDKIPDKTANQMKALVSAAKGDFSFMKKKGESEYENRKVIFVDEKGNVISNDLPSVEVASNSTLNVTEETPDDKKGKSPAALGINRVHTLQAKWAVLQASTPVIKLNGDIMGNAPAGSVFFVEKRIPNASGMIYEGRFNSKKMTKTVRIDAKYVIPFSGDYNKLSDHHKETLKKYYELNGKAEERKAEVLKENLSKSPYLAKAAAALKKYNTASKRFKEIKNMPEDFRRKATYKLTQLKDQVQELNQKHKEWKEQHQSELNDYINDPKYIEIIAEREKFHDEIPGLAY